MNVSFPRQGDLLLIPVGEVPATARKLSREDGKVVLLHGKATGDHTLQDERAELFAGDENDPVTGDEAAELYLLVQGSDPVSLVHEEHAPIPVEPGAYLVGRQCQSRPRGVSSCTPQLPPGRRATMDPVAASSADARWSEVSGRLRGALNDTTYATWFGEVTGYELAEDRFVLAVPNDFTRDWIEGHFRSLIGAAIRDVLGHELPIELRVVEQQPRVPAGERSAADAEGGQAAVAPRGHRLPARAEGGPINARYTFDSFVIGSSNRFAHAAALAVAEAPAQAYNPLFIYGGTGLGKTHLLQAIAQYVSEHFQHLSVRYVTSETFLNDFINSLRHKRIEGFKQRYRTDDLLLIDDVQFFENKERIQEEFFHTFNSLYEAGSQIVISSDRPPRDIATLEERLRTRFEWGLITDIQPPDLETRIAILRKKVKLDGIHVHDEQVLTSIASRVSTSIRELEGALTRVVASSSLTGRPMTVELTEDVLEDVFPQGEGAEVSIRRIQDLVAERFSLSLDELCGERRSRNIVYPRQVAMYLSRELTDSSLPKIGKEFGGRDHTTVIHATSKIARLIREDRSVHDLVQDLTARLPGRPRRDSRTPRRQTPPRRG